MVCCERYTIVRTYKDTCVDNVRIQSLDGIQVKGQLQPFITAVDCVVV